MVKIRISEDKPLTLDSIHGSMEPLTKMEHIHVYNSTKGEACVKNRYGPPCDFFECGHLNYGTKDEPATVFYDCSTCGKHYCEACNYDKHLCHFCGNTLRHDGSELTKAPGTPNPCYED